MKKILYLFLSILCAVVGLCNTILTSTQLSKTGSGYRHYNSEVSMQVCSIIVLILAICCIALYIISFLKKKDFKIKYSFMTFLGIGIIAMYISEVFINVDQLTHLDQMSYPVYSPQFIGAICAALIKLVALLAAFAITLLPSKNKQEEKELSVYDNVLQKNNLTRANIKEIKKLKKLLDNDAITKEEYEEAKAAIKSSVKK